MLRLGIKEFFRRIYTNIFTALQLSVVFILLISIISSVQSRTELYTPVKDYLDGNGIYTMTISADTDIITEKDLKEKYSDVDSVLASYITDAVYQNGEGKIISYNDEIINMYTPKLDEGSWFESSKLSDDMLYGVASYSSGLKVNDTVEIENTRYDESDKTFTHPIEEKFAVKIIGVLSEHAQVFGADTYISEEDDFRNLYADYDESKPLLLLSQKQLTAKKIGYTINTNKQIIKYKNGLSDEQIQKLNKELGSSTPVPLKDFRSVSELYVYEQIIKLLPILICIVLLVIVSTVSISALNVKSGLRTYSIYYVCGCDIIRCLGICLLNCILTVVTAIVFALLIVNAGSIFDLSSKIVISMSVTGFFACSAAVVLQIICSMIMPITLMSKSTLKNNLITNE